MNANEVRILTDNQLVDELVEKIVETRSKMRWWQKVLFDSVISSFLLLLLELQTRLKIQQRERFNEHEQII
jgi:hypothetical protein